jgi:serine/threonine protein kinase
LRNSFTPSPAKSLEEKYSKKIQFKDFDIIEVIGEGSFGRVYKGQRKDTGDIFALKVMKK